MRHYRVEEERQKDMSRRKKFGKFTTLWSSLSSSSFFSLVFFSHQTFEKTFFFQLWLHLFHLQWHLQNAKSERKEKEEKDLYSVTKIPLHPALIEIHGQNQADWSLLSSANGLD